MTAESLAHHLKARRVGSYYMAPCVAHEDRNPSLSIREVDGKILVHCHAGCRQSDVVAALKARGLWPERDRQDDTWRPRSIPADAVHIATYDYRSERGDLQYQVLRYEWKEAGERRKTFSQRHPDGRGGWTWRKHPRQVLYRLPEVLEAPIVFITEGEKDVETLRDWGFVATTNAGGANAQWLPEYSEMLRGHEVIIIPDADTPGQARGALIARSLLGIAAKITLFTAEDLGGAKDITEWFDRGHAELELIAMIEGPTYAS